MVPLGPESSRHTTLGLLTKAKAFIKVRPLHISPPIHMICDVRIWRKKIANIRPLKSNFFGNNGISADDWISCKKWISEILCTKEEVLVNAVLGFPFRQIQNQRPRKRSTSTRLRKAVRVPKLVSCAHSVDHNSLTDSVITYSFVLF